LTINNGFSQEIDANAPSKEFAKLFDEQRVLPIKMQYSQKDLRKNTKDSIYTISSLSYQKDDDQWGTIDVKLKARGNFRRDKCYFPPVSIKIKKSSAKGTAFEGNTKLKLVMPCLKRKDSNDDVIKELMAYKMYEVLSPYHFKTRMLQIEFDDLQGKKEDHYSLIGFLIENDKTLAKRKGGKLIKRDINPMGQEVIASIRSNLFQFMIGNVDFSAGHQHNCKLIYVDNKIIPIPYDFDMSGFVDPVYGVLPSPKGGSLGISNIKQRLYRGFKRDNEHFQIVRQEYLSHKDDVMQILRSFEADFTNPKAYKRAENYILSFFKILESDMKFKMQVMVAARNGGS
jgi:hypothetical protein